MKWKKVLLILLLSIFVVVSISFPYDLFTKYSENMVITHEELEDILQGDFIIRPYIASVSASSEEDTFNEYVIKYKLFNLFNIHKLKVNVIEPDRYFAGGNALGFSLQSKGVILIGGNYIVSNNGVARPFEDSGLHSGDIILEMDGIAISNVEDISDILDNYSGGEIMLTIKRSGEILYVSITPAYDIMTRSYRLGLWVKEDSVGIGTLTFINATTNRFGSLGHSINDADTNECVEVSGGNIYSGKILGVKKGSSGNAGELLGTFSKDQVLGSIDKNCEFGVYGYVDDTSLFTTNRTSIELGGRLSARPGLAQIYSCIDGENIEKFDIEIIKTNFQKSSNEKSMVLRVIDKDLISRTGGIVQGMSGSPIIQDGKLIGAVTHVFVNDATKGFGIYIDWMVNE